MATIEKKTSDDIQSLTSIDKIIHEPARLNILAHLYVIESADFLFMMRQTELTFGNLSAHMSKLETAGYIKIIKEFVGKKPHTMLKITGKGKQAFDDYKKQMKQFFNEI
ncbi:MAG: transcriptional regulator [Candidatus Thermoplasmatota archaeon]|jgi:DNA-binding transcriptional ArsR family regulator|nr:transcriptional regulator [Candidatus Thermoplasmatota archaeon]